MSLRLLKAAAAAIAFCGVTALSGPLAPAIAQTFERPVRIVVPYAPGGTSDILARLISPKLSEAIGQPVVVENKPGAAGNIGADAVAKAKPDGHTLLLLDVGSLALAPSLFPDLSFNVESDLAPVGMVMFGPYVLAVHPSVPAKTVPELVAYAKANPGKLAAANSGIGGLNHITAVALARDLGIEWKTVPYKGGSAASRAVVGGESNVIINGTTATLPFVTSKQLVGLAVTGDKRLPSLPDAPTFKEAKLPLSDVGTYQGLLTTGKTSPELVAKLNAELNKILALPEIQEKLAEQGGTVRPGSPADMKAWLSSNIKSLGDVVRSADIKIN
ncbi:exported protein [Azorhizobium oxalatiphilum]|uniref:Exported protein n=1 Tax=Azorhizobium oxalatiphilum TaxID=980631 RepID=A0A917CA50_9HYPH|nr:tripartite tricarboxylate transporter substrate binding protein [Azorhizobium oxalatiphilum]GGF78717.1 exported protein [Azorhizobium oxalatiphilum]